MMKTKSPKVSNAYMTDHVDVLTGGLNENV